MSGAQSIMKTFTLLFILFSYSLLHGEVQPENPVLPPVDPAPVGKPPAPVIVNDVKWKGEMKKFQGIWKPVAAEYRGNALEPSDQNWTLVVSDDTVIQLRSGNIHVQGSMELANPSKGFHRAFWRYSNGTVNNAVIYFFVGKDSLVTCWNGATNSIPEWPTDFSSGTECGVDYLVVWKRQS